MIASLGRKNIFGSSAPKSLLGMNIAARFCMLVWPQICVGLVHKLDRVATYCSAAVSHADNLICTLHLIAAYRAT